MDVRMPDGTIIKNVPDGTTKAQLLEKLGRAKQDPNFRLSVQATPQNNTELSQSLGANETLNPTPDVPLDIKETMVGEVPLRVPFTDVGVNIPVSESIEAGVLAAGETARNGLDTLNSAVLPEEINEIVSEGRRANEAALQPVRDAHPVATTVGDVVPAASLPGGARVATAAVTGAGIGALSNPDDPLTGAVVGTGASVLGNLGARMISRVITPFPSEQGISKRTRQLAKKLGFKLSVGARTNSASAKNVEAAVRSNPLASGQLDRLDSQNTKALNRAALRAVGGKGDELSDSAVEKIRKELGKGFESFGDSIDKVDVPDDFLDNLDKIIQEARLSGDSETVGVLLRNVDDSLDVLGRGVDGRGLIAQSSRIDKRATRLSRSGNPAGELLFDLKESLDGLVEHNAGPSQKRLLQDLRRRWKNLRFLRERNVIVDGDVSPGRLRQVIQSKDPDNFRLGKFEDNELFQIARLQEGVRDLVGNSGTATRESLSAGNIVATPATMAIAETLTDPLLSKIVSNNLLGPQTTDIISALAARISAQQAAQRVPAQN